MSTPSIKQTQESPKYALNLLPLFANFNDNFTWNKVSGETNAVVQNTQNAVYAGNKSLTVSYTGTDEVIFNAGDSSMEVFIEQTGQYILSYRFFKSNFTADIDFKVNVYVNGVLYPENIITQNLYSSSGFTDGVWNAYTQVLNLEASQTIDFSFSTNSDDTGHFLCLDGMSLLLNDRELSPLNVYREVVLITREIEEIITIDIPSIASNASYTATVTFTGVAVGDYIQLVPPIEIVDLSLIISIPTATAPDTVKFTIHNSNGVAINPASGDYKFKTTKYGDF